MRTSSALLMAVALGAFACAGSEDESTFGGGGGRSDYVPPTGEDGGGTGGTGTGAGDDGGGGQGGGGAGGGDGSGSSGGDGDGGGTGEPEIVGTGYSAGDTAYDLEGTDGSGGPWSLHDQLGHTVVLVVGNAYNAQVTDMLEYMTDLDSDARVVFFAKYDENTEEANAADAARWSGAYGITAIVQPGATDFTTWGTASPPRLYVIDEGMQIEWVNSGFTSQSELESKL